MQTTIDLFPSKLAKHPRFCNRVKERENLKRNIKLGRHTVLVSPRRYGKSSLVHTVIAEIGLPFASIDLFLAHNDKAISKRILTGISQAISQLIPVTQKALKLVQDYFKNFRVVLEAKGFSLQVSHAVNESDSVEEILESLKSLANLAAEKKKSVVLFLDEFQDIAVAENSKSIEGAIRHIAQESTNLIFIFSGSNRGLLQELFDDNTKPLYLLCDKMFLERMSSTDYEPYIQEAAHQQWKQPIAPAVFNKILTLTELHPFYVNLLCNELWKKNEAPQIEEILSAWQTCYEIEERRLISELEKLTKNQQDILKALAVTPTKEFSGQKFLNQVQLSVSSVQSGIKSLLEKDMIYQVKTVDPLLSNIHKDQYRILDPLLNFTLKKYT